MAQKIFLSLSYPSLVGPNEASQDTNGLALALPSVHCFSSAKYRRTRRLWAISVRGKPHRSVIDG